MKSGLLLDVVVAQRPAVLELLTSKDETLLVGRNTGERLGGGPACMEGADAPLLVLNLCLDIVDSVGRLHLKGDRLPCEGLDENLHFWQSRSMA